MGDRFANRLQGVMKRFNGPLRSRIREDIAHLRLANVDSAAALIQIVHDSGAQSHLRETAAWFVGQLREKSAMPALLHALKEGATITLTWEAAKSLSVIGGRHAVPILTRILRSSRQSEKRVAAAYALGVIGDSRATAVLIRILNGRSRDARLRDHAAEALGRTGGKSAIPPLLKALGDPAPEVRGSAAYALGQLGAHQAIDKLRQLTRSSIEADARVRKFARDAITDLAMRATIPRREVPASRNSPRERVRQRRRGRA